MNVIDLVKEINSDFFTGVPDSLLKPLCDYLMDIYGINGKHHIIAANEGNCAALAAGYHMATGNIPVVYLQNSGEGNIINPVASLLNDNVYAIPCIFIVGWRGEPGIKDEPQHIYQGKVTVKLLEDMNIKTFIINKDTSNQEIKDIMKLFNKLLTNGKSVAFVVSKNALSYDKKISYKNNYKITREQAIEHIVKISQNDPVVSTTGKASRELFEIREANKQSHCFDFLTVGSMGHSSSIALGIALNKTNIKIWCIDGDGAVLMHMGALALLGANSQCNIVHIVINNESHETVGGFPTAASKINLCAVAKACGYPYAVKVDNIESLDRELLSAKERNQLCMIEILCAIGARENLGRPTTSALENKQNFVKYLSSLK